MAKPVARLSRRPVRSLAEFIRQIEQVVGLLAPGHEISPWFRGHGDATWSLIPKIYRVEYKGLVDYEEDLRDDFQRQAWSYLSDAAWEPKNMWEWYFLMQHYGVPTRLLDWTESALIALYFAIKDAESKLKAGVKTRTRAAVWALNPGRLNQKVAKKRDHVFTLVDPEIRSYLLEPYSRRRLARYPIAIQPPHKSHRIAAQQGYFTVHGRARNALEAYRQLAKYCVKIEIDASKVLALKEQLRIAGIAETTVLPELAGLCTELVDYWMYEHPA